MAADKGELDLSGAKQNTGVWLVKLPKYLAQQWTKATGRGEVGKLRIAKNHGKTEVSFTLNEELASIQDIGGKAASSFVTAPREHPFQLQSVGGQTLTVFTENLSGKPCATKEYIEGLLPENCTHVNKPAQSDDKSENRTSEPGIEHREQQASFGPLPPDYAHHLDGHGSAHQLEGSHPRQIEESSKPKRQSQQIEKAVTTNYKPVSNHQYNIEYERKKKDDGKRARGDKQQVLDMLFSAFEKHQYYNLKDLVEITKQPVNYLKEILRDIGIYNMKGTHKNTWELRPEYRHYQSEEKIE